MNYLVKLKSGEIMMYTTDKILELGLSFSIGNDSATVIQIGIQDFKSRKEI